MTGQDLKNSILQLAIQGKLVPQNPDDEPASVLLERIKAEKKKLIEEKKIKKEKPLPEITEDEKPFEIPDNWVWVRFGEITSLITDGTHNRPTYVEKGIPFLSVKDISSGKIIFDNCKFISKEDHATLSSRCNPQSGDLLITKVGSTGIPVLVDTDVEFSLFVSVALIKFVPETIYNKFIQLSINAPLVQSQIKERTRGVGNPNWVLKDISETMLALPPLSEQKRIVAKIKELMPLVDEYDKAQKELDALNSAMPKQLKQSILQEAIMGKLGTNNPDDEPASELLKRIRQEKEQLIKDKKIKKEKPLPEITDEEKTFDIPDNWVWCRWGDLSFSIQYGYNASAQQNGDIRMVRISDIQNNEVLWDSVPYCKIKAEEIEGYLLKPNDILFARTGGTVGKSFLVKKVPYPSIYAGYLIRTRYSNNLVPQYLKYFMESRLYWEQLREGTIATAQPNCNGKTLGNMRIPLPPLAEQHRIVSKIENLFACIEPLAKDVK